MEQGKQLSDCNGNTIGKNAVASEQCDFTTRLLDLCRRIPCCGIILSLFASIFFGIANLMVKFTPNINPFLVVVITLAINFIFYLPFVIYLKLNMFGVPGERLPLICRCFCGFITLVMSYVSFRMIPLADSLTIISAAPVFVSIFGWMILKEECGIFQGFTITLTLIGVLLISKPTFIFGRELLETEHTITERTEGSVIALISCLSAAGVYIALRKLSKTPALVAINTYALFCIICSIIVLCVLAFVFPTSQYAEGINWPTKTDALWLILNGFAVVGAQISLTVALKVEEAGLVALTRTSDIVVAFIFQICFLSSELIHYTSYIGAVIIFISVWLTATRRWLHNKPDKCQLLWRLINCGMNRARECTA